MHTVLHEIDMQMLLVKGLFCAPRKKKGYFVLLALYQTIHHLQTLHRLFRIILGLVWLGMELNNSFIISRFTSLSAMEFIP
jgi:hypothetical protein